MLSNLILGKVPSQIFNLEASNFIMTFSHILIFCLLFQYHHNHYLVALTKRECRQQAPLLQMTSCWYLTMCDVIHPETEPTPEEKTLSSLQQRGIAVDLIIIIVVLIDLYDMKRELPHFIVQRVEIYELRLE